MVGIIKQVAPQGAKTDTELGVGEFQEKYFPHPVYIDEKLDAYKYLGSRSILKDVPFSWNPFKLYSSFTELGKRLKDKNIEGNLVGEGATLGGVVVYSRKKGVVYEYKEITGSLIPKDAIENAIKTM